jgi:S-adenosylmethionine:tRNA ribosyltransferase-isomerase
MLISDFDFDLPDRLIAQHPLDQRDASRMLVLDRDKQNWTDRSFRDLPNFLRAGDLVVLNNTRVFPARLIGSRQPTGGRVELFLIREVEPGIWEALARPAKRLAVGSRVGFGSGRLIAEVIEELPEGRRRVRFESAEPIAQAIEELGLTPLPPYIKRDETAAPADRERYQTVYARSSGAIAAPTAGLHFTPEIFARVRAAGADLAEITLHVGYGTFEPVRVDDISEHRVAPESFEISVAVATQINRALNEGRRIIAIGTTTVRALESACGDEGKIVAGRGEANITIVPGYEFRVANALLTNFHLPRSSLLVLVSSLAGRDLVLAAYRHAVASDYRFYSYGDCMLII